MKSSSIHNLNADRGLNPIQKVLYLFLNWVNNLFPHTNSDSRIEFKKFEPKNLEKEWENTYPDSSAPRKFSDIFWRALPWGEIKKELGEIHIFDTGCGHGNYGARIQDGSGGLISSYTGVDAKRRDNWGVLEEKYSNFHFIESSSNDISSLIPPGTNVFISQSAIEHFDQDLAFFEQLRTFIDKSDRPIIQIHLFPAKATLPLYLFHGLRQYTPRTISKITQLFDSANQFFLFGLGGDKSKKLHWKYFTWPVLITRKYEKPTFDVSVYEKELRQSVESDLNYPSPSPLFWALIIYSHPKGKIW
mgnify:CR=1 FL=1